MAENMGSQRERVAQLLSLLSQDSKRTICWSLGSPSLWFAVPQLSVQVRVIMVLGVNRADWLQLLLSSNIKTNSTANTAGFELAFANNAYHDHNKNTS